MHVIVQLVVLNRYVPFWDIVYFWYTYYAIWVILNLWQTIWRVWTYDPTDKMATRNYLLFTQYNSPPVLFLEYNGHMAVHLLLLSCLLAKCFSWLEGRVCMATYKQGPSVKDEGENSMGLNILFHTRIRWSFASQCHTDSVWGAVFPFFVGKW